MVSLFIILLPIALIDSASILPIGIVPLLILFNSRRPLIGSLAFIAGIFCTYIIFCFLITFGLSGVFDTLHAAVTNILKNPRAVDIALQIIIGIGMAVFGFRIANTRKSKGAHGVTEDIHPWYAFHAAVVLTLIGLPGSLPFFAAANIIIRSDQSAVVKSLSLVYYTILFVFPLCIIVGIRILLGEKGDALCTSLGVFVDKWSYRIIVALLIGLGLFLILDGIGWFFNHPIIPY